MQPSRLRREDIEGYLAAGHWSRETMVDAYRLHARQWPERLACSDAEEAYTWLQLETASDRLAANLIGLGLARDARVLVQMPSSCREFVIRIALKKAGLIGVYAPMQWREREMGYVLERVSPVAVILPSSFKELDGAALLCGLRRQATSVLHRFDTGDSAAPGWRSLTELMERRPTSEALAAIAARQFAFDEVSLITASSGTSGLAKLCEWPEAAQMCIGRGIRERLQLTLDDKVGMFSPLSGAAAALLWTVSGWVPCQYIFPSGYSASALLDLVQRARITVVTTVPVILSRLAQQPLESYDLGSLRALRVGTAAMGRHTAASLESRTGCRVVPAAGSMECPGFGHAGVDEPAEIRLDGSVGRPLPGCRLRIVDEYDNELAAGEVGELKVTAPFASSGYWRDPQATQSAWSNTSEGGWYRTGDIGRVDDNGRLTLVGRRKELINRSGHKILPLEVERVIAQHPDVFECAVVGSPDPEYGEVPWAFVQPHPDRPLDVESLIALMQASGLASYKIPLRFFQVSEFPRVSGNKIDKKQLLGMHRAAG